MLNIIAKISIDTNFYYEQCDFFGFSSKNPKMFPGDKMPKMVLS